MISGIFSDLDHHKTLRHDGILVIANKKCSPVGVHFLSKLYNNPFVAILTPASSLPTGEKYVSSKYWHISLLTSLGENQIGLNDEFFLSILHHRAFLQTTNMTFLLHVKCRSTDDNWKDSIMSWIKFEKAIQ